MKKDKKTPSIGIIVILAVIILGSAKSKSDNKSSLPAATPKQTIELRQTKTLEELESKVRRIFDQTHPDSYEFFYDDNLAVLSVWNEYMRQFVVAAVPSDERSLEWWTGNLEELRKSSATVQEWFDNGGHPEITVVLNIVNAGNHNEIFACASRGEIVYDVVADRSGNS